MISAVHSTQENFETFSQTLESSGVRPALAFLLGLTDYRFIGIFRFENGKANAAVHYDRENPNTLQVEEEPESATYCCFVRDSGGAFTTADSMADARLATHPKREQVAGYCGVPVMDPEGAIIGTLCHYDVVPRDPRQIDMELIVRVASALAYGGHVPPYPRPVSAAE